MDPVLAQVKELLEIDVEDVFDGQLLLYLNAGLQYLSNNRIPVGQVEDDTTFEDFDGLKSGDYNIVLSWLHLYCLQRFDRTLMQANQTATANWIDGEMTNLIYQLKTVYDQGES